MLKMYSLEFFYNGKYHKISSRQQKDQLFQLYNSPEILIKFQMELRKQNMLRPYNLAALIFLKFQGQAQT